MMILKKLTEYINCRLPVLQQQSSNLSVYPRGLGRKVPNVKAVVYYKYEGRNKKFDQGLTSTP